MKLDLSKEQRISGAWLLFDLLMVGLVVVNLSWIVFDALYANAFVQQLFVRWWPSFARVYGPVHANFLLFDLYFVAVFLVEFFARWAISVVRREYFRWFFYPFVHWYDLLGCLPVGGMRWLRFLRLVVVFVRLRRMGLIDPSGWAITKWLMKYYDVFVEELSDRIVVNIVHEAQNELRDGHPLGDEILRKIIDPHRAQLIQLLGERLQQLVAKNYPIYQPQIEAYVRSLVRDSTQGNTELKLVNRLPFLGARATQSIETAIADILLTVADRLVHDFGQVQQFGALDTLVDDAIRGLDTQSQQALDELLATMLHQSLELVIERISVQRWKSKHFGNEIFETKIPSA